jgi:putative hydrolase of the HAD superfamily
MPKPYRFILFDFVNTLFLPDPEAVPTIEVDGKRVVSTAPVLKERMARRFGHLDVLAIHRAHREAWQWVEARRGETHKEIAAAIRFRHFLSLLGVPDADDALVQEVVEVHMGVVTGAFRLPVEHRRLLERLRRRFHLGILSNFDYAPALRRLLEARGIAEWFDPVVISADIGCRKPGAEAFAAALARAPAPLEAVLHVGDTWVADVEGACGASIDVAWINLNREAVPPHPKATYVIENLSQLGPLLE